MIMVKDSNDWFPLFRQGEEPAFRIVFERYYRPVCYFAAKLLKDESFAEDIVSDSFRKAWDGRAGFKTQRHLENFLYIVTRNACLNKLRGDRFVSRTDEEWAQLAENDTQAETPTDIERVQSRLISIIYENLDKIQGGDVLRMSFIEGRSTKEIAGELGMTENNVYIIKSRSLKQLRKVLSEKDYMLFLLIFMHW